MFVQDHLTVEKLRKLERSQTDAALAKRFRIIILAIGGWTAPEIAMAVGLARRTCQLWIQRYNEQGVDRLFDREGRGRRPPLTPEQERQMRERIDGGPLPEDKVCSLRGADIKNILENEFDVCRSLSATYDLLHRLGYSCLQPRPEHYKCDRKLQERFKQELPEELGKIAKAHPEKLIRVYFQDEARFGQQGSMTRVWAPKGSRPRVVRQTEYQYVWVIGAVCPKTGRAEGLLSPRLNVDVINVFLSEFSQRLPEDEHAVMIWDGAGFHTGKRVVVPENVTLIVLPPYSPELNPIENLWHYLKSHYWSNRTYASYEALEKAAMDSWHEAALDEELMKTVCAADHVLQTRNQ